MSCPGFLRGGTDHSHGLVGLSVAARQHGFTDQGLWDQCLRLGEERYLLPGIADPAQAAALTTTWGPLAGVLADLEAAGLDVLVDAGRLGTAYAPLPLLRAADAMVLVTGTRLPDVYALSRRTASLRSDLAASQDHESLCVLTVGEGRPYSNREIEASLGVRVGLEHRLGPGQRRGVLGRRSPRAAVRLVIPGPHRRPPPRAR